MLGAEFWILFTINTAMAIVTATIDLSRLAAKGPESGVELGAQELTNTSWAFAEIRCRNLPLIEARPVATGRHGTSRDVTGCHGTHVGSLARRLARNVGQQDQGKSMR